MGKNTSVIGIYEHRTMAADAIRVLRKAGYRQTDIAVLSSENQGSKDFAHEKHTRSLQGAAVAAMAGAITGGALACLFAVEKLAVPGLDSLVAAGPVLAAFAGAGAAGAIGWISGFIVGARASEYVAKRYAGRVRGGGLLVSVHCDSPEWRTRARKTMKDTGAQDISEAPEAAGDFGATDRPAERAPGSIGEPCGPLPESAVERPASHNRQ